MCLSKKDDIPHYLELFYVFMGLQILILKSEKFVLLYIDEFGLHFMISK